MHKRKKIDQDVFSIWTDTDNKKRLGLKSLILTGFVGIELTPIDFEKKKKVKNIWYYIITPHGKDDIYSVYIYIYNCS